MVLGLFSVTNSAASLTECGEKIADEPGDGVALASISTETGVTIGVARGLVKILAQIPSEVPASFLNLKPEL